MSGTRRRRTAAEKAALVAKARKPGRSVSMVARQNDVNANLLFRWMRAAEAAEVAADGDAAPFIPVDVTSEPDRAASAPSRLGAIAIDLPCGARVRCDGPVDEQALASVFRALGPRP